jgi:hypothetical protein
MGVVTSSHLGGRGMRFLHSDASLHRSEQILLRFEIIRLARLVSWLKQSASPGRPP